LEWQSKFFSAEKTRADLPLNLLYIARHIAQSEGEPPVFFPFGDRDNHDLDKVAQKFGFEDKLGAVALNQALMTEYRRPDRYWQAIYCTYNQFKSQFDACINRLLDIDLYGIEPNNHSSRVIQSGDEVQLREPSEDVKEQVKSRDGYQCLCCGETKKRLLQIDHVAPSYYGGNNSLDNLQTLCKICNQAKGINTLNFRIHETVLTAPAHNFPTLSLPKDGRNQEECQKFLCRSINSFYRCAAVQLVKIGKRGQFFYEWYVYLYSGNNSLWLQPHLNDLVKRINAARREAGLIEIEGIRISAPDKNDVVSTC
jgi:ATP-dependent helicase IRC3